MKCIFEPCSGKKDLVKCTAYVIDKIIVTSKEKDNIYKEIEKFVVKDSVFKNSSLGIQRANYAYLGQSRFAGHEVGKVLSIVSTDWHALDRSI